MSEVSHASPLLTCTSPESRLPVTEWQVKTMKVAVAMAIIRIKPPDNEAEIFVKALANSWCNRNIRDERYIRWLELERLKLLHKTVTLSPEEASVDPSTAKLDTLPMSIDPDDSVVSFMKSLTEFLNITQKLHHNPDVDFILSESIQDLSENIKTILQYPEDLIMTIIPYLENCCHNLKDAVSDEKTGHNLVKMSENLLDFLISSKRNASVELKGAEVNKIQVESHELPKKTETTNCSNDDKFPEDTQKKKYQINLTTSHRTEKQMVMNCVVYLAQNPSLAPQLQKLIISKVKKISENVTAKFMVDKPEIIESLYYLIEGMYRVGMTITSENKEVLMKCVDTLIVKHPVSARLILICCLKSNDATQMSVTDDV